MFELDGALGTGDTTDAAPLAHSLDDLGFHFAVAQGNFLDGLEGANLDALAATDAACLVDHRHLRVRAAAIRS